MVTEQKQGQVIYALIALTHKQTNSGIYFGECATDEPLPENASQNNIIFAQSLFMRIQEHRAMLNFLWLHNHYNVLQYEAHQYGIW